MNQQSSRMNGSLATKKTAIDRPGYGMPVNAAPALAR